MANSAAPRVHSRRTEKKRGGQTTIPDQPAASGKSRKTRPAKPAPVKSSIRKILDSLVGITMRQWLTDPQLFGPYFAADSWFGWKVLLIAFCGEPLISEAEKAKYKELTGRDYIPGIPLDEFYVAASRRIGKTSSITVLCVFFAFARDYSPKTRPGERPMILLVAKDKGEASEMLAYIKGYFDNIEMFHGLIEGETSTELRLVNGVRISVLAANFRSIRSRSIAFGACDELAFWMDQGANPAEEVLAAIRPSLYSLDGKLACISSPYGKFGPLWDAYKKYGDGSDPKLLFVKGCDTSAQSVNFARVFGPRT